MRKTSTSFRINEQIISILYRLRSIYRKTSWDELTLRFWVVAANRMEIEGNYYLRITKLWINWTKAQKDLFQFQKFLNFNDRKLKKLKNLYRELLWKGEDQLWWKACEEWEGEEQSLIDFTKFSLISKISQLGLFQSDVMFLERKWSNWKAPFVQIDCSLKAHFCQTLFHVKLKSFNFLKKKLYLIFF